MLTNFQCVAYHTGLFLQINLFMEVLSLHSWHYVLNNYQREHLLVRTEFIGFLHF